MSSYADDSAVLAVDVGGTKAEAALVRPDGRLIGQTRHRASTGQNLSAHGLTDAICSVVHKAKRAAPGTKVVGVGAGVAGPIDDATGRISPINLPALQDFPIRETISEAVWGDRSGEVCLRRDGVAIVLAEQWLGAARGSHDVLGIVISTGIGGGLIVGGRALAGNAGHIGQMDVSGFVGRQCLGRDTMLESVASGPNVVAWARAHGFSGHTGEELATAYSAGDDAAVEAIRRCAMAVGQAVCSAVALVPVQIVAIGGGFTNVSADLVPLIANEVARHPLPYVASTNVVPAALGDTAPLVGAAALVYRRHMLPG